MSVNMQPITNQLSSPSLKSDAIFEYARDQVKADPNRAKSFGAVLQYNIIKDKKQVKQWTMDLKNARVYEGPPDRKPNLTVTISDEDILEIFKGKLNPESAFMNGKVKVTGDFTLAEKLVTVFKTLNKL